MHVTAPLLSARSVVSWRSDAMEEASASLPIVSWSRDEDESTTIPATTGHESDDSVEEMRIPESLPEVHLEPLPEFIGGSNAEHINGDSISRIDSLPPPRLRRHSSTKRGPFFRPTLLTIF